MHLLSGIRLSLNRFLLAAITVLIAASIPSYAQTARTTPVEVKNPVSIDQGSNTVSAQQSGTWNVGITGTPSVSISGIPGVSITNTPYVNLAGSPTVCIDEKHNIVQTSTQSSMVKLWDENKFVAPSTSLWSNDISCKGYKEVKIIIKLGPYGTDLTKVDVKVYLYTPSGTKTLLGKTAFSGPTTKSITQGDLQYSADSCIFSVPVMSDNMAVQIYNGDTVSLPIYSIDTWAYLVN